MANPNPNPSPATMVESRWMTFELQEKEGNRKTDIVRILGKSNGAVLGTIRWYGAWRCYAFFPAAGCLFNQGCLEDINMQIRELMVTWRLQVPSVRDGHEGGPG